MEFPVAPLGRPRKVSGLSDVAAYPEPLTDIAYDNGYKLLMFSTLATLPLLLVVRKPERARVESMVAAE